MGRRRHTADEHRQNGTYRADRYGEPLPVGILKELLPSPFPLSERAQRIYSEVGQKLVDAETLKATDIETLAQYAMEAEIYIRCMEALNGAALVVELHNKVTAPNHYRKMAVEAQKLLSGLGDRLGLNPRSRHSMKGAAAFSDQQAKNDDPIMSILNAN